MGSLGRTSLTLTCSLTGLFTRTLIVRMGLLARTLLPNFGLLEQTELSLSGLPDHYLNITTNNWFTWMKNNSTNMLT